MTKMTSVLVLVLAALFSGCYQPVSGDKDEFGERTPASESLESTSDATPGPDANTSPSGMESTPQQQMNDTSGALAGFRQNVSRSLSRDGLTIASVANESDTVEKRVFEEYGAVYLTKAKPPSKAMFVNEAEVVAFQTAAGISRENMGGVTIELQPAAMSALKAARSDAQSNGLSISPREGTEAGRRSYEKTLSLWNSRFEPALKHWKSKGRLNETQIARLRSLPIKQQVAEVLDLEKQGIYFNTFFNNSILYSVAAPGTSQHLSMVAFDVTEYANPRVQKVLAENGWFRTVQNDAPHFTYLGYKESELPGIGLKKVNKKDGSFWIPDI